jgi:hypothetical protein
MAIIQPTICVSMLGALNKTVMNSAGLQPSSLAPGVAAMKSYMLPQSMHAAPRKHARTICMCKHMYLRPY